MRAASWKRRGRRSFTLVELLAVVAIIGILVSLITAAAYMAVRKAKRTKISMEAKQLEMACLTFRERFHELPPDFTDPNAVSRLWQRMFPLSLDSPPDLSGRTPADALVYWLGGPLNANGRPMGWSPNPRHPAETTTTEGRIGPFFEFDQERLVGYHYYPPGVETTSATGMYVYFRNENGDYAGKNWSGVVPLTDNRIAGSPWVNPESCQIICGGLDGTIGTGSDLRAGSDYNPARWDDQANFLEGTFEDARE